MKLLRILGLALVSSLLLNACGQDASPSNSPSENPVAPPVVDLAPGGTVAKTIPGTSAKPDSVFATFHADSGSTYRITLVADTATRFVVGVRDTTGGAVYVRKWTSTKDSATLDFPCTRTGTYAVAVAGKGAAAVKIRLMSSPGLPKDFILPDEAEPDNRLSLATLLKPDTIWTTRTLHSGVADEDWFKIPVDSGMTYSFQSVDSGRSYASIKELYGSDSSVISSGSSGVADYPSYGPGFVYLRVLGDSAGVRYRVRVVAKLGLPAGGLGADAYESDDTRATAKPIPTDSSFQFHTLHGLKTTTDVDWVAFSVDSGMTYAITIRDTSRSMSFQLETLDTVAVAYQLASGSTILQQISAPCAKSGRWRLRLSGTSSTAYSVAIMPHSGIPLWAIMDPWESDDTIPKASLITTNGTVQNRTLHRSGKGGMNPDVVAFAVDSGKLYTVRIVKQTNYLSPTTISDSTGKTLESQERQVADTTFLDFPALKSGRRFIHLTATGNDGIAYGLSVTSRQGLPAWAFPERGEPDSGISSAMTMPLDSTVLARRIDGKDSVDWIKVSLKANTLTHLTIRNLHEYRYLRVRYLKADSTKARAEDQLYQAHDYTWTIVSLRDSVFFLQLSGTYTDSSVLRMELYATSHALPPTPPDTLGVQAGISQAVALVNGPTLLRSAGLGNADWMKVAVDSGDIVVSTLGPYGTAAGMSYFAADSTVLNGVGSSISGYGKVMGNYGPEVRGPTTLALTAKTKGFVFIAVGGPDSMSVAYTLNVQTYHPDTQEPDNSLSQAVEIPTDGTEIVRSSLRGDEDWLKFHVAAGQAYQVHATGDMPFTIQVLDSASATTTYPSEASEYTIQKAARSDGWMYIELTHDSYTSEFPVHMKASVTTIPNDRYEPNNTRATATPLPLDSTVLTLMAVPGDTDWLRVHLEAGVSGLIRLRTPGYIEHATFDSSGKPLFDSSTHTLVDDHYLNGYLNGNDSCMIAYRAPRAMDVWLRVTGQYGPYTAVAFTAPNDAYEPDDDSTRAKPLPTDGSIQERSFPGNDVDWILAKVDSGARYEFVVQTDMIFTAEYLVRSPSRPGYNILPMDSSDLAYSFPRVPIDGVVKYTFTSLLSTEVYLKINPNPGVFNNTIGRYKISIRKLPQL